MISDYEVYVCKCFPSTITFEAEQNEGPNLTTKEKCKPNQQHTYFSYGKLSFWVF